MLSFFEGFLKHSTKMHAVFVPNFFLHLCIEFFDFLKPPENEFLCQIFINQVITPVIKECELNVQCSGHIFFNCPNLLKTKYNFLYFYIRWIHCQVSSGDTPSTPSPFICIGNFPLILSQISHYSIGTFLLSCFSNF